LQQLEAEAGGTGGIARLLSGHRLPSVGEAPGQVLAVEAGACAGLGGLLVALAGGPAGGAKDLQKAGIAAGVEAGARGFGVGGGSA